jgi:hypothetical protein
MLYEHKLVAITAQKKLIICKRKRMPEDLGMCIKFFSRKNIHLLRALKNVENLPCYQGFLEHL